ncbi:Secretory phospholipase A2 receptor [Halotydeus destructor]|nr:Secretory phospholipase A2 receptor [Halotydeus destructor]
MIRIESRSEQDWIVKMLEGRQVSLPVWLDAVKQGDTYTWSDGSAPGWSPRNDYDYHDYLLCSDICHISLSDGPYGNGYSTWTIKDSHEALSVVCEETIVIDEPATALSSSFTLSKGFLSGIIATKAEAIVQDSFSQRHGNKIYHFDGQQRPFQEAKQYCSQNGHRLVRIDSESEIYSVASMLKGKQIPLPVWLGAVKPALHYWNPFHSFVCKGVCHASISQLSGLHDEVYYDLSVDEAYLALAVVCEELVTHSFNLSKGRLSEPNTLMMQLGFKMYYMPLQYMTREQAEEYCNLQHDQVVRVSNFAEQSWLKTNMAEGSAFWLGAYILHSEQDAGYAIQWPNQDNVTWTNWNENQPSCATSCSVFIDQNDEWITEAYNSTLSLKTVCERDLAQAINDRIDETQMTLVNQQVCIRNFAFRLSMGIFLCVLFACALLIRKVITITANLKCVAICSAWGNLYYGVQYSFTERLGNKVYHFERQRRTLDDAQEYCSENGHRLVRIESETEQDWIVSLLSRRQVPFPVWLDAVKQGDTYTWSDGMAIVWNKWDTNSRSQCTGSCHVYLSGETTERYSRVAKGTWLAKDTAEAYSVVCEEPLPVPVVDSSFKLTKGRQADSETLRAQYGLKLYYMPLQYMTRTEAETYCNLQHDQVARATNFAEQSWLKTNMAEGSRFWLGAYIPESENGLTYSVQWPNQGNVTWTNWADNEPNCISHCSVVVDKNDKWLTKPYNGTMALKTICERNLFDSLSDRINNLRHELTNGQSGKPEVPHHRRLRQAQLLLQHRLKYLEILL